MESLDTSFTTTGRIACGPKKILFICLSPSHTREKLARLCKVSLEKFNSLFDYGVLFQLETPWNAQAAHERACQLLRETPHPFIVIVGQKVAEAFTVKDMEFFVPFPLSFDEGDMETGKQVRAAIKIVPANDAWYRKPANTRRAMLVLSDLTQICGNPMTETDILRSFGVVEALGDDLNYWTKKVLKELKEMFAAGKVIDRIDMSQLMQSYANDVQFKNSKEPQ